jgi:hypothetical protein
MRKSGGFVLLVCVALAAVPQIAAAQDAKTEKFEAIAEGAVRVDRGGLAGLVWSLTAPCDQGDELAQRQCRAVRAARVARFGGKRFLVRGDASAFTVGAFDSKKSSAPLAVSGCIACVEPIEAGGHAFYIVSKKAAPSFQGNIAKAAPVHETARTFKSDEDHAQWRTTVVPRLATEFVVELPADPSQAAWKRDGKEGLAVEIVGFRVFDPCDGGIICASPKSERAKVDRVACGENVVEGEADDGAKKPTKVKDNTPDELTAHQIKAAMAPVRDAAAACFEKYNVAGDAKLKVTVAADGAVVSVETKGDFAGTPTGSCVEAAVKAVVFPKTKKARQSFNYPIVLR